jgi:hypothetical protein
VSGCSPDQEVIVSACVRGYTITHPVPISAGLCHRNTGAMSAVFAPRRPPRKRAVLATGQQIILPFSCHSCSARSTNWQSGNLTKCALIQTTLRFVCRAVCDAQKTEKRREFSGQDVGMSDRARALRHSPPGQGCTPTPRQRLTAREKIPRPAHRSRTRQTENRGGPSGVPIL